MKWPEVCLEDILTLEYGHALRKDARDSSGDVPVAGSNGVDGWHSEALVDGPGIVIGRKGSAGKVTWFDTDFWPIDTTFYVTLKIDSYLRWVYYLLNYLQLDRLSIVTGVPGLNRNDAYRQQFSLPPYSEQRRIAEILDQADALRKKRAEADKKTEKILPALFYKMFGDPFKNSMGWHEKPLHKCCEIVTGNTPSTKVPEYYGGDIRWARPADIDNQVPVMETEKTLTSEGAEVGRMVPASTVLVVCIGATLGKVGLAGRDMAINQQINALLPSEIVVPKFLYVYCSLVADRFRAAATKSTLPILNKSRFGHQKVFVPPKDLQENFSRTAAEIIDSKKKWNDSRNRLESLFKTLLYRAFTGDLTSKWREAHMKELLTEMEEQAKVIKQSIV